MSNYLEAFAPGLEQAHARGVKEGEARGAEKLKKERERRLRLGVRYRAAVGNVRRLEAELKAEQAKPKLVFNGMTPVPNTGASWNMPASLPTFACTCGHRGNTPCPLHASYRP